jgi:hypothetical protein
VEPRVGCGPGAGCRSGRDPAKGSRRGQTWFSVFDPTTGPRIKTGSCSAKGQPPFPAQDFLLVNFRLLPDRRRQAYFRGAHTFLELASIRAFQYSHLPRLIASNTGDATFDHNQPTAETTTWLSVFSASPCLGGDFLRLAPSPWRGQLGPKVARRRCRRHDGGIQAVGTTPSGLTRQVGGR